MSKIGVVAKVVAMKGKEDLALQELQKMVEPTLKEPGCIKYVLHKNIGNQAEFWFVEEWTSVDALEKHKQTPHFLELTRRKAEFAESGEIVVLSPV